MRTNLLRFAALNSLSPALLSVTLLALPVSATAAPPIEAYGTLPQVEFLHLSPSGQHIAMIGVVNDKRQLLIFELPGNKPLKAIAVSDNKVRDVEWVGEDHVLVQITATVDTRLDYSGRQELSGFVHIGLDAKPSWVVFQNVDSIEHSVRGYYGHSQQDGHWYGYFGGITRERARGFSDTGFTRQSEYIDLYRVDLDSGKPELVSRGSDRDGGWVVSTDGSVVAHAHYDQSAATWSAYPGSSGAKAIYETDSPTHDIGLEGLGRTAGTVLVAGQGKDGLHLREINTADGSSTYLFADQQVLDYTYDPITGLLLGAEVEGTAGEVLFDSAMQARFNLARKAFSDRVARLESGSQNLDRMIIHTEGTRDSGTFWLVNSTTHRADPLGYAYPQVKPDDVGAVRMVSYTAADGLKMEGVLTLPPGRESKSLPLIVFPHGGPIGENDGLGFDWWAQALASRGYAVFQPNYRGSGGYSADFLQAGYGEWGGKMLSDIADGAAELTRQGIADAKRVCIMGGSYGGYAALAGVTLQQGLYRCAVAVAAPANMTDFVSWIGQRYGLIRDMYRGITKATGADSGGDKLLHAISPTSFASRADAPVLLIHGHDDTAVPFEQSQLMASALKSAHKPYEFVELEKEDHLLSHNATRIAMLKATVEFIEKYNPPR